MKACVLCRIKPVDTMMEMSRLCQKLKKITPFTHKNFGATRNGASSVCRQIQNTVSAYSATNTEKSGHCYQESGHLFTYCRQWRSTCSHS